jgi:hypothetical protein
MIRPYSWFLFSAAFVFIIIMPAIKGGIASPGYLRNKLDNNSSLMPAQKGEDFPDVNKNEKLYKKEPEITSRSAYRTGRPGITIFRHGMFMHTGKASTSKAFTKPEPPDWYAGDIHVHRSCDGSSPIPASDLPAMMKVNDLAVISVLADMGNNQSADRVEDLKKVNSADSPLSDSERIIHYGAEWHWDADQWQFPHQALGGHLVLLGLKEAHKIWEESSSKILDWAAKQHAVRGFAHIQYLDNTLPDMLNCCIPVDYPVEAALQNIEFIAEEQPGGSDNGILAYYRLLNCGFRLSIAGGTDYSCNNVPLGSVLTYVEIPGGKISYQKWIEGIAKGRTVVSRNGHNEFLNLKVNGTAGPGKDIRLKEKEKVTIQASWSVTAKTFGLVELVYNGRVIAKQSEIARPGNPLTLTITKVFPRSGWICARRMDSSGHSHILHTSPVYVTINGQPVRVGAEDAQYFISWIDTILRNIAPGGRWNRYFPHDLDMVQERYKKARDIYSKILIESYKKNEL